MDKQDELAAVIARAFYGDRYGDLQPISDPPVLRAAAAIRSYMGDALGFGTDYDASLNLQGALDDLRGRHDPNDGGVCAAIIERVIGQIEHVRAALGTDIGGGRG